MIPRTHSARPLTRERDPGRQTVGVRLLVQCPGARLLQTHALTPLPGTREGLLIEHRPSLGHRFLILDPVHGWKEDPELHLQRHLGTS
jgi:hypothetical protein